MALAAATCLVMGAAAAAEAPTPPTGGGGQAAKNPPAPGGLLDDLVGFDDLMGQFSVRRLTYSILPPVTDIRGRVHVAEKEWRFENAVAAWCGGSARGAVTVTFAEKGSAIDLDITIDGVELAEICRHFEYTAIPGQINGRIALRVDAEGNVSGRAVARLRDSNLAQFPLVLNLLRLLNFDPRALLPGQDAERGTITRADAEATFTPRGVVFQTLSLGTRDGAFTIEAERLGRIGYDGTLDLYFRPKVAPSFLEEFPFLDGPGGAFRAIKERGGRVRAEGAVKDPVIRWAPLR